MIEKYLINFIQTSSVQIKFIIKTVKLIPFVNYSHAFNSKSILINFRTESELLSQHCFFNIFFTSTNTPSRHTLTQNHNPISPS